jgi:hypothetical protein
MGAGKNLTSMEYDKHGRLEAWKQRTWNMEYRTKSLDRRITRSTVRVARLSIVAWNQKYNMKVA